MGSDQKPLDWMQYSEDKDYFALVDLTRAPIVDPNTSRPISRRSKPPKVELYVDPADRYWQVSVYGRCIAEGQTDPAATPALTLAKLKALAADALYDALTHTADDLALTLGIVRDTPSASEDKHHEAA